MNQSQRDDSGRVRRRPIRFAAALVSLVLLAATAGCSKQDTQALLDERPIEIHVPTTYDRNTPAPLLVVLHGYAFTGKVQSLYFALGPVAEARNLIYVAPDGTPTADGKRYWNATDACCAPADSTVDDSTYLAAVIDDVSARYNVDPKRIFVMGHSNGGFMAYRMACDHADVVAAVVSLEGAMYDDPSACDPSDPVSVLEVHGTSDVIIRYEGGKVNGSNPNSADYPSAPDSVLSWARLNGCSTTPDAPPPADRILVAGLPPAKVTAYSGGCEAGGHAELWTQPDGTHIPDMTPAFTEQLVDFLLAHPKP